jgi:hypothetical protein
LIAYEVENWFQAFAFTNSPRTATQRGTWINRSGGIGAGCDSFFEYLMKAYVMFGDEAGGGLGTSQAQQLNHELETAWLQPLSLPLDPSPKTGYKRCSFTRNLYSTYQVKTYRTYQVKIRFQSLLSNAACTAYDEEYYDMFTDAYVAVMKNYHDDGWYHEAHLDTGAATHLQATSLQAFWPGWGCTS